MSSNNADQFRLLIEMSFDAATNECSLDKQFELIAS